MKYDYGLKPLKFWCQKVLPLVYDESLSYEELLCKVVAYLNNCIETINDLPEYIQSLLTDEHLKEIFSEVVDELREQIARANEGENTTASYDRSVGELVWLDGKLVRMTRAILAGDRYVEDDGTPDVTGNFVYTSVEIEIQRVNTSLTTAIQTVSNNLADEITNRGNADTQLQGNIDSEITAREEADRQLQSNIDDETLNRQSGDSALQNSIESIRARIVNTYKTVSDMQADETLTNGDYVETLGYRSVGIGGCSYLINNTTGTGAITLNNGLYALPQIGDEINMAQLGAIAESDISTLLLTALSLINYSGVIHFNDDYMLNSNISITLNSNKNVTINGHEHTLNCGSISSGTAITITGASDSYNNNFNFINLSIIGNDRTSDGIRYINFMSGINRTILDNFNISNFMNALTFQESRMFLVNNAGFWNNIQGIIFEALHGFSGDSEIRNSQFATYENTGNGVVGSGYSDAHISGITIDNNDFYPADVCIKFNVPAVLDDVWITNNQFDNTSNFDIQFNSTANTVFSNIIISENYETAGKYFLELYLPNGKGTCIQVNDNYINGASEGECINVQVGAKGAGSYKINGNMLRNCSHNSKPTINASGGSAGSISNNVFDVDGTAYQSIRVNNTSNIVVVGNVAKPTVTADSISNEDYKVHDSNLPT